MAFRPTSEQQKGIQGQSNCECDFPFFHHEIDFAQYFNISGGPRGTRPKVKGAEIVRPWISAPAADTLWNWWNQENYLGLPGNYAGFKQVGQIGGVRGVTQKWRRAGCGFNVEDFLHGTQVGGMRKVDRAGVRKAVLVVTSEVGDDNLPDRVVEVVPVIPYRVAFGFVPPEDDHTAVLVGVGRHN